jgi:hypothetical protein
MDWIVKLVFPPKEEVLFEKPDGSPVSEDELFTTYRDSVLFNVVKYISFEGLQALEENSKGNKWVREKRAYQYIFKRDYPRAFAYAYDENEPYPNMKPDIRTHLEVLSKSKNRNYIHSYWKRYYELMRRGEVLRDDEFYRWGNPPVRIAVSDADATRFSNLTYKGYDVNGANHGVTLPSNKVNSPDIVMFFYCTWDAAELFERLPLNVRPKNLHLLMDELEALTQVIQVSYNSDYGTFSFILIPYNEALYDNTVQFRSEKPGRNFWTHWTGFCSFMIETLNGGLVISAFHTHYAGEMNEKGWLIYSCIGCGANNPQNACSGCKQALYCNRECQLKHWNLEHSFVCSSRVRPPLRGGLTRGGDGE